MRYVTIEREYGSSGTEVAKAFAKECNVPCYGQEILEHASKKMDISIDEMRKYEETATNSLFYSLYVITQVQTGKTDMLSKTEKVFLEEQNTIREFSKSGSAVFLGHCACEALKDCDDVIKVYIYANSEYKRANIKNQYGIEEANISSVEKANNKRRANYYQANTQ